MSRPLRLDLPNCFYHVLDRGVDRRPVSDDQADHEKLLELLGLMSEKYSVGIWSEELVAEVAAAICLTDHEVEELRTPVRRRQRPKWDLLTYPEWRDGHHAAEAAGEFLRVARTALPSARTRVAAYLGQNRKLKAKLRDRVTV